MASGTTQYKHGACIMSMKISEPLPIGIIASLGDKAARQFVGFVRDMARLGVRGLEFEDWTPHFDAPLHYEMHC